MRSCAGHCGCRSTRKWGASLGWRAVGTAKSCCATPKRYKGRSSRWDFTPCFIRWVTRAPSVPPYLINNARRPSFKRSSADKKMEERVAVAREFCSRRNACLMDSLRGAAVVLGIAVVVVIIGTAGAVLIPEDHFKLADGSTAGPLFRGAITVVITVGAVFMIILFVGFIVCICRDCVVAPCRDECARARRRSILLE